MCVTEKIVHFPGKVSIIYLQHNYRGIRELAIACVEQLEPQPPAIALQQLASMRGGKREVGHAGTQVRLPLHLEPLAAPCAPQVAGV